MKKEIKIIIGLAAFALLILCATLAYNVLSKDISPEIMLAKNQGNVSVPDEQGEDTEPEMIKAPDFTVEDAEGNHVKLSDMEGQPVVLNFWASWCPPCKAEMPEFDRVYSELGDEVAFMMVNMTDGGRETKEDGAGYVSEHGFSFPVYYDIGQDASYTYGIRSIPTTIFIDSAGYIITGAEGQLDEKTLRYGISLIQTENGEENMEIAE